MKNTSKKYILFLFFISLLYSNLAFSNSNLFKGIDYKKNHIRFHQDHVDFIKTQHETIAFHFEYLINDLVALKNTKVLLYLWKTMKQLIDELTYKSEIFQNNCINTEKTSDAVTGMNELRLKIVELILLKKSEIELAISSKKYGAAKDLVSNLNISISTIITSLYIEAENYSNLCSSKIGLALYKTKHLEFHQQHIDFMLKQKSLLDEQFAKLYWDIDAKKEVTTLSADWESLLKIKYEFYCKSKIYTSDCMDNDKTISSIRNMMTSNTYIYTKVLPDKADIELSIDDKQYNVTRNLVNGIEAMINKETGDLLFGSDEYLKNIH